MEKQNEASVVSQCVDFVSARLGGVGVALEYIRVPCVLVF